MISEHLIILSEMRGYQKFIFLIASVFLSLSVDCQIYHQNQNGNNWRFITRTPPVQRPVYQRNSNQQFIRQTHITNPTQKPNQFFMPSSNQQLVKALNKIPASWMSGRANKATTTNHRYYYQKQATTTRRYGKFKPVVYWNKDSKKGNPHYLPIHNPTTKRNSRVIYFHQNNKKNIVHPKSSFQMKSQPRLIDAEQDLSFATRKSISKKVMSTTRKWKTIKNHGVTKNYNFQFKTKKPTYVYAVYPHQRYDLAKKNRVQKSNSELYFDRKTGIAINRGAQTRKVFYRQTTRRYVPSRFNSQRQWNTNHNSTNLHNQQVTKPPSCHRCDLMKKGLKF